MSNWAGGALSTHESIFLIAFFLIACLLTTGCRNHNQVSQHLTQRKAYWQAEMDKLPIGANQNAVHQWLHEHQLDVAPYDGKYSASLDKIETKGGFLRVCDAWFVHLEIIMDSTSVDDTNTETTNKVASKKVSQIGSCI